MEKSPDNLVKGKAVVKLVICFTDGLSFDILKKRLSVTDKDVENADRFSSQKDKTAHLISAYLKRRYVGSWTVNGFGKPVSDGVFFNVSHCEKAVVIALSDAEVGVDVENVREVNRSLIEYVSGENELQFINSDEDFFRLWTAKESICKAQGKGLITDVKHIPAFPLDGKKEYDGEKYFSHQIESDGVIITVVRKGAENFVPQIEKIKL